MRGAKGYVLIAILMLTSVCAFAQGMYGFQAGLGRATSYSPHSTFAFEGYYYKRLSRSVYAGGDLSFQRYSFTYDLNKDGILNINHKSSYLFLCPKVDFGIGYRKYVHISAAFGPGLFLGGQQLTAHEQTFFTNSSGNLIIDTVISNTTHNIPTIVYRYGIGVSERIPTYGRWNIMLSQEFSIVASNLSKASPALNTSYISFQVGIMHKYPQVLVEY